MVVEPGVLPNRDLIESRTQLLLGLFVTAITAANLLGPKITRIGVVETSVGIFVYPLTFLITDIVTEVHGRPRALAFVRVAFACVVFASLFTVLAVALPFAPRSYVQDAQYTAVFGTSIRFLAASLIAFLASQMHDVWAFDFWKRKTSGKWLWLRNNASTIVSQAIDTLVFMFIALSYVPGLPSAINTNPRFTPLYVLQLAAPFYGLKVIVALLDTPFCYLGVKWLRGRSAA